MKLMVMVSLLVLMATGASGLDYEHALAYQAQEMADCAAYYTICYSALEQDNASAPENEMALEAGERAMEYSLMMSQKGTAEARVQLSIGEMIEKIDGRFSSLAVIMDEHGETCRQAIENPFERLKFWLGKQEHSADALRRQ